MGGDVGEGSLIWDGGRNVGDGGRDVDVGMKDVYRAIAAIPRV